MDATQANGGDLGLTLGAWSRDVADKLAGGHRHCERWCGVGAWITGDGAPTEAPVVGEAGGRDSDDGPNVAGD